MRFGKYKFKEDFTFKDNRLHLKIIPRTKKITGSRIGALLGNDPFKSPFQLWCELFGFFEMDQDTYFLEAGRIIEDKLRNYLQLKSNLHFQTYDPREIRYDLFKDHKIFGGIPDGEEKDSSGNVLSILEIKTAQFDKYEWVFRDNQYRLTLNPEGNPIVTRRGAGLSKWFRNGEVMIPQAYQDQLSLYLYLRNITTGYFCVAFLKHEDYLNPPAVIFRDEFNNYSGYKEGTLDMGGHILIFQRFDLDLPSFSEKIKFAEKWYEDHILTGISPELTPRDLEWLRYGYPELYAS